MLCDDIAYSKFLRKYDGFDAISAKIITANKFVLAPDFASAADGLVDNFPQLRNALPFCRLPYKICWIELAQADRPHFRDAELGPTEFVSPVQRVGWLLEATDDTLARFNAHMFWTLRKGHPGHFLGDCSTSFIKAGFDSTLPLDEQGLMNMSDFGHRWIGTVLAGAPKADIDEFAKLQRNDWGGEARYLIAVLGLFNARNVADHVLIDKSEHNKKRAKHGQLPLASHVLLKVRTTHKVKSMMNGEPGESEHGQIRAHFVRGHFKQRKSGLFFWNPHLRGNLEIGYVAKDYQITR